MTYQVSSFFPLGEQFALNHEQHSHWLFEKPLHKRMFAQRLCQFKRRARAQTMNEVARNLGSLTPQRAPPYSRAEPLQEKGRCQGDKSPRVAQRDNTKQTNKRRNEGISLKRQSEKGVRQKRAWGEKEEQAERRCGKWQERA